MIAHVTVAFVPEEGAVRRILGQVARRGYRTRRLSMQADHEKMCATMKVDVSSIRADACVDHLKLQLGRLYGVTNVAVSLS